MTDWRPETRHEVMRTELSRARQLLDAVVPEKELQRTVVELAQLRGWLVWHDNDSRRNAAGLPDLLLCRPPRFVVVEMKAAKGRVSAEQRVWIERLGLCPGIEVHVWRPGDLSSGIVEEVLR